MHDTFLVMNADVLTNINYDELLSYHKSQGGLATLAAYEKTIKIDLGIIVKNGDGSIVDYVEKPTKSNLVSMGIYIFEPRVLHYINGGYPDFPDLVKLMLKKTCRFIITIQRILVRYRAVWDYARANEEIKQLADNFPQVNNNAVFNR